MGPLGERAPVQTGNGQDLVPPTFPAPEPHWAPSNLALRIASAAVLIPPVFWVCYRGGWLFVAVVIAFAVLGVHEFFNVIAAKGAVPARWIGVAAAALLPLLVYVGDALYTTSLMTAVLLGVMILQLGRQEIREAIVSVSATFFGVVYVGWLMSHAVSVRFVQRDLVGRYGDAAAVAVDPQAGFFFMILCLTASLGCDAGAYFVGRAWGAHALAPTISPNKTVEGAIGGVLVAAMLVVAAKVLFDVAIPGDLAASFSYAAALAFGLTVPCAAVLGDLAESLLKRDAHVKDAGWIVPGVGGVLDRIDSVLFSFPVAYYFLLAYYRVRLGL